MSNKLEQLRRYSDVVADTGDIEAIKRFKPLDATTNPSLLLKAAELPAYQGVVSEFAATVNASSSTAQLRTAVNRLGVAIGTEITRLVPGRVSTEVDAKLSFDTQATIAQGREIMELYAQNGVNADRILIKIASTWEGIEAAKQLEREGIQCNLTLLFSFAQAQACADAGVTLISPFVGRIYDWYKKQGEEQRIASEDRGVQSVRRIFSYYKTHGYKTIVMGASFRNTGQIEALAGCDRLTISPTLLAELENDNSSLTQQLSASSKNSTDSRSSLCESDFRFALNEDAMATEKLAEGIRLFSADLSTLQQRLIDFD